MHTQTGSVLSTEIFIAQSRPAERDNDREAGQRSDLSGRENVGSWAICAQILAARDLV